jgi:ankyrin repeat protein
MAANYERICEDCELNICDGNWSCLEKRYTPVIYAVEHGTLEEIETLLNKGADINEPDIRGYTPLIKSVLEDRDDVIKLLLSRGADVNIIDKDGYTFNNYINKNYKSENVRSYLYENLPGIRKDMYNELIYAPILYEVDEENIQRVEELLNKGADINEPDIIGQTPLIKASLNYNFEMIKLLLSRGADVNIIDKDGCTFKSHLTVKNEEIEVNEYLDTLVCNIKPAKH